MLEQKNKVNSDHVLQHFILLENCIKEAPKQALLGPAVSL